MAAATASGSETSQAMTSTAGSAAASASRPLVSRSKTTTRAPAATSFSTRARPSPRTPPVTMAFLSRTSTSADRTLLAEHALDLADATHRDDVVEAQLEPERLLDRHDQLHVPQRVPGLGVVHREGIGELRGRNLKGFRDQR